MGKYTRTDEGTFTDVAKTVAADAVVKGVRGKAITAKNLSEDLLIDYAYENWLRKYMIDNSLGFDEDDSDGKGIGSSTGEAVINKAVGKTVLKFALNFAMGRETNFVSTGIDYALGAGVIQIFNEATK